MHTIQSSCLVVDLLLAFEFRLTCFLTLSQSPLIVHDYSNSCPASLRIEHPQQHEFHYPIPIYNILLNCYTVAPASNEAHVGPRCPQLIISDINLPRVHHVCQHGFFSYVVIHNVTKSPHIRPISTAITVVRMPIQMTPLSSGFDASHIQNFSRRHNKVR